MQTAHGYDELPPDVVEFRRRVIDLLWNPARYEALGSNDDALTANTFDGLCLDCGGLLKVEFDPRTDDVVTECVYNGCSANTACERLGLPTER
jgi:hypothetical protein